MRTLSRFVVATSVFGVLALLVVAQERREQPQPNPQPSNPQRNQATNRNPQQPAAPFHGHAAKNGDQQLATWLISDNEGEVAIAKFALDKSGNSEVKEFAEQMIHDHNQFLSKLRQFAPMAAPQPNAAPARREAGTPAAQPRSGAEKQPNNQPANRNPQNPPVAGQSPPTRVDQQGTSAQAIDLAQVKQEIGRQCVETFKKELSQKKGKDFDKCYMGQQVGAHLHMGDTLMVMKDYASPQLRAVIEEGEKTAQEHLDHAKQIMKDLEGDKKVERTASTKDE